MNFIPVNVIYPSGLSDYFSSSERENEKKIEQSQNRSLEFPSYRVFSFAVSFAVSDCFQKNG